MIKEINEIEIEPEEETIKTDSEPPKPCLVCQKPKCPYQCPRCKKYYCSLECYQKHNLNCTEEFYKENVIQHLKNKRATPEEQKKMKKILEENKYDEEDVIAHEIQYKRAKKLETEMLKGELSLESLTLEEQKQFAEFLNDTAAIEQFLKQWTPWWTIELNASSLDIKELDKQKPRDLTEKEDKIYTYREQVRERYDKLVELKKLLQKDPHPSLPFHLVNLCYGFVILARFYNGDFKTSPCELVLWWIQVSDSLLNVKKTIPNLELALNYCTENLIRLEGSNIKFFLELGLEDLQTVINSKFYVFELLFQAYDLVHIAHEKVTTELEKADSEDIVKKSKSQQAQFAKLKHKIIFFLSYCKENNHDFCTELSQKIYEFSQKNEAQNYVNKEFENLSKMKSGEIRLK